MIKRNFICLILFGLFMLPVAADESGEIVLDELDTLEIPAQTQPARPQTSLSKSEAPKWEEFCESGYENAKLKEQKNILNIINFVDAEQSKSNYWAERRANFEKALEHCNTLSEDEKSYCYDGIRNTENERNEIYELQRKQINYKNQGIVIDKTN